MIQSNVNQAFIFAAGRGERMRPLTDKIPKPLVRVADKSIINYSIEKILQKDSFERLIINGFYLADKIQTHINKISDSRIHFSWEKEKLETGGGLLFAKDKINFDKPLLIINGDIVWKDVDDDISLISKQYFDSNCDILMGLKKKEDYFGYESDIGDFNMDPNGNLSKLPDQKMDYAFVGIAIINPKILLENFISEFGKCFSMSKIYQQLINENSDIKRIKGVELKGDYFHIGNVEYLEKINEEISCMNIKL